MKLDTTKIILGLVMLLQAAVAYIGRDIQSRLNRLEDRMETNIKAGLYDKAADFIAEKDSLTAEDMDYLRFILETSE